MTKYIETTLAHSPNFFDETLSLLETAFKYPSHQSFLTDFYPLLGTHNHEHCHILVQDGKVVGHIGINRRTLLCKSQKLEVLLIGGIAIHPSFQGQGVFSSFFESILDKYRDKAALMFLWSDLTSLYNKFDFYEAGGIIQTGRKTLLKESLDSSWIESNLKDISIEQFREIKSLYNSKSRPHLLRTENDWSAIREVQSAKLYYKENENNEISSYFIIGKGNDLPGIIHEYFAKDEEQFFKEVDTAKLWLPELYNSLYHKKEIHYGHFVSISSFPQFSTFLLNITDSELSLNASDKEKIYFNFKDTEYALEKSQFLTSLFGPNPIEEFENIFKGFMINGLDSV